MDDIALKLDERGRGTFRVERDGETLAKMEIAISGNNLTVFHTEVSDKLKGQGAGSRMLATMADYARKNTLKVIPLCPFVHAQFRRHAEEYADIWNKQWHETQPGGD